MASQPSLVAFFRTALRSHHAAPSSLQILRTIPSPEVGNAPNPGQLLVLDSSFNPPTRAHLHIATSAVQAYQAESRPTRLVLLLATMNADKAAQPAAFEQRLSMMTLFAEDVLGALANDSRVAVDIGVTKLPYFVEKAKAIAQHQGYAHPSFAGGPGQPVEQIHLVGYDTLIRIFNPKYYPPNHDLAPLQGLFDFHRLRVTCRPDKDWGTIEEQKAYVEAIRDGQFETIGATPQWADKIEVVQSEARDDETVSSTAVRAAAKAGEQAQISSLCSPRVADWIYQEGLYLSET